MTFGAGQLQQSQVMAAALTLELPVNHHPLWGQGPFRGAHTDHVLGGVAAVPGGGDSGETPNREEVPAMTPDLPADAGRRREGPAGAQQGPAADRAPVPLLGLEPQGHLPGPGGPAAERKGRFLEPHSQQGTFESLLCYVIVLVILSLKTGKITDLKPHIFLSDKNNFD